MKSLLRDRSGSSAVEFAITAPVLLGGLVMVVDIGLAMRERMLLDQSVRAGAEFAMNNVNDETTIENMVKASATGVYGTQPGDVNNGAALTVDATSTCECPNAPGTAVSCTALCTGDILPYSYWTIAASRNYNALILPDFALGTEIKVQVR
jgi:Flp pilus assembly protein TadG